MKKHPAQPVEKGKIIAISALFLVSAVIVALGAAFSIYCVCNGVEFYVLTSRVPGVVFGLAVMFLGVRYILAVRRLKKEVYKPTSEFSWRNFRKK
ncbi:MAG TPA: hypothetical protein PK597_05615 [Oscillospiraceae bacterium]|nr:hypothetical protein [Oscillospiraceae bacterium]HRW57977.1 hypothetical protein [Oscillospiraceae bacterium]